MKCTIHLKCKSETNSDTCCLCFLTSEVHFVIDLISVEVQTATSYPADVSERFQTKPSPPCNRPKMYGSRRCKRPTTDRSLFTTGKTSRLCGRRCWEKATIFSQEGLKRSFSWCNENELLREIDLLRIDGGSSPGKLIW